LPLSSLKGAGAISRRAVGTPRIRWHDRPALGDQAFGEALDPDKLERLGWLNAVENFFSKMTRQRIRRGVFRSIADLQAAINAYLAEHNTSPKPFVWTKSAEAIMAKLERCRRGLSTSATIGRVSCV
jgi:hypothetical protein